MVDPLDKFVLVKKGETPDPRQAQPFDQALSTALRQWDLDKSWELYNVSLDKRFSYDDRNQLKAIYAAANPKVLQVRDERGNSRPSGDLSTELGQLKAANSGLYCPVERVWVVDPPSRNPHFDEDLASFGASLKELGSLHEVSEADPAVQAATPPSAPYETEVLDTDMDLLPGISGNKLLEGTIEFFANAHPLVSAGVGMLAGVLAYRSMGVKGVVGLVMAYMMLKRVMTMGSKVIQNQRLDLVARSLQEGIPVGNDGRIDAEFLDALRNYPAGDHALATRTLDPAVSARHWNHNPIQIDANIPVRSYEETIQQVVDGDSFFGKSGAEYRLVGVNTPELQFGSGAQVGAQLAWDRVRELLPVGTKVRVEVVENQPAKYGRLPVYVYAKDAEGKEYCLNQRLLEEGLARITNFHPYHPKMQDFVQTNLEAIGNKVGMWNKRFNPAMARPGLLSINKQTTPNPAGGETISFSMG